LLVFVAKNTFFFEERAIKPPLKTHFQRRATPSTTPGNSFVGAGGLAGDPYKWFSLQK